MAEFSNPPLFEVPARGNPLECCDEISRQMTRIVVLPDGEEIMTLAYFILTQYRLVRDGHGQTDRRTDIRTDGHVTIAITRASITSRG